MPGAAQASAVVTQTRRRFGVVMVVSISSLTAGRVSSDIENWSTPRSEPAHHALRSGLLRFQLIEISLFS
jgi:hypothetical protein